MERVISKWHKSPRVNTFWGGAVKRRVFGDPPWIKRFNIKTVCSLRELMNPQGRETTLLRSSLVRSLLSRKHSDSQLTHKPLGATASINLSRCLSLFLFCFFYQGYFLQAITRVPSTIQYCVSSRSPSCPIRWYFSFMCAEVIMCSR